MCWYCFKPMGNSIHKDNGKFIHARCQRIRDYKLIKRGDKE